MINKENVQVCYWYLHQSQTPHALPPPPPLIWVILHMGHSTPHNTPDIGSELSSMNVIPMSSAAWNIFGNGKLVMGRVLVAGLVILHRLLVFNIETQQEEIENNTDLIFSWGQFWSLAALIISLFKAELQHNNCTSPCACECEQK